MNIPIYAGDFFKRLSKKFNTIVIPRIVAEITLEVATDYRLVKCCDSGKLICFPIYSNGQHIEEPSLRAYVSQGVYTGPGKIFIFENGNFEVRYTMYKKIDWYDVPPELSEK